MLAINRIAKKSIWSQSLLKKYRLPPAFMSYRRFTKIDKIRIDTRLSEPTLVNEPIDNDFTDIEDRSSNNLKSLIIEEIKK